MASTCFRVSSLPLSLSLDTEALVCTAADVEGARASMIPGEGGPSFPIQATLVTKKLNQRAGDHLQPNAVGSETIAAEVALDSCTLFGEYAWDRPTEGFDSIQEAIEDVRQVVVDDEDRENEGDLIMAASKVAPEAMACIVKHGTGIVCVSMKEDDSERVELPQMVNLKENEEKFRTAFTITVDAKHGTTTGVSASDRAKTILALASTDSKPEDFNRPGHIFPLEYREGGVLRRPGQTQAAVVRGFYSLLECL